MAMYALLLSRAGAPASLLVIGDDDDLATKAWASLLDATRKP